MRQTLGEHSEISFNKIEHSVLKRLGLGLGSAFNPNPNPNPYDLSGTS